MDKVGTTIPLWLIITILVIVLIIVGIKYLAWRVQSSAYYYIYRTIMRLLKEEPLEQMDFKEYRMEEEIQKIDAGFDQVEFLKTVENVMRQYCKAMSENEHRLLLSFETPNLFQRHKARIEQNKKAKVRDVHGLQEILGSKFLRVSPDKNRLTVEVRTNMFRYKVNQNGTLLSGSQSDLRKLIFVLTFHKAPSAKERMEEVNCPNCGAPHSVHSAGICEYCGSMIVAFKDNWLLDDLQQR